MKHKKTLLVVMILLVVAVVAVLLVIRKTSPLVPSGKSAILFPASNYQVKQG